MPIFELLLPILTLGRFFGKPKVNVQMMGLVLVQRTDEVYVLGVEPHIAEEFPEGALYKPHTLFGRVDFTALFLVERNKAVPQHFVCLRSLLYRFEFLLRDKPVSVKYARRLFKVRDHIAHLRLGIFSVQFPVRGHVFVDIVSAVRHFIIRSLVLKFLAFFRRGVAFQFPRRICNVEDNWLIADNLSSFKFTACQYNRRNSSSALRFRLVIYD